MSPKGHKSDLARLLDGELHDVHEVERINSAIKADQELMDEFEEQRGIKSLLGELSEFEAPDYMSTRVMGEINARRAAKRRATGWKQVLSGFGGVAVVAALALSMNSMLNPLGTAVSNSVAVVEEDPGREYSATPWTEVEDEGLRNLLQRASDAHRHSELEHLAGSASPNIDDLVLMVGQDGGSN